MLGMKQISVITTILCFSLTSVEAQAPNIPPPAVLTENVVSVNHLAAKKYVGLIKARLSVELPARISGTIEKILFKEGELVQKGQLLFEIEDTPYRAKADSAKASVEQIQAELEFAENDFVRQEGLYNKKAVSQIVYLEAKRLLLTTRAKLAQAKANLLDASNSLSYTKIYAPITGIISKATYCPDNYVTPASQPLADIAQITPIYVRFALSERDFMRYYGSVENLKKNGQIQILLANGKPYPYPGEIFLANNKFDSETGTILVWCLFTNPERILIPGGFATVLLSRKLDKPLPAVKLSAVMTDGKDNYVYTVDSKGLVSKRIVKLGDVVNNMQIVESGLQLGEQVIVDGTHKARPGMTVKAVSPAEAAKKGLL